jgi:N-methylhydantoinase A/oxoprolinase/acetone carboxylase beta subunit
MVAPTAQPALAAAEVAATVGPSRPVRFAGQWLQTPVVRGEPGAGLTLAGPVVFELPESTFFVPPMWSARVDEAGSIVAEESR